MPATSIKDIKCAIVTGGYSGLGKAMSESLLRSGKKVILVGRTEEKLQKAAKDMGAAGYYVLDTGDVKAIPDFIAKVTKEHPDVDCIINNAGVQRPFQILGPDYGFDLDKADQEIDINIRGPMHLCVGLVPHLNKQSGGAVIVNVSSVLGYLPSSVINPVYNGSKAWIHFFTTNLRTQLEQAGSKISVIEVAPPTVSTDLHRERQDPSDNSKDKNSAAMSTEEFIKDVEKGWQANSETIAPGPAGSVVPKWFDAYGDDYKKATKT